MASAGSQTSERLKPADILAFARGLTAHGFDFHPHTELLLNDLLFLLIERGEWPDDPRQLRPILAPVLCSSPQQQADFNHLFDQFAGRPKRKPRPARPRPRAPGPSGTSAASPRRPAATALELTLAVIALAAIGWELNRPLPPISLSQPAGPVAPTGTAGTTGPPLVASNQLIVQDPSGNPVPGAQVRYLGLTAITDAAGACRLTQPPNQSFSVLITLDGYQPSLQRREAGDPFPLTVRLYPIQPQLSTTTPPPTRFVDRTGWQGWVWNHRPLLQGIAAALPFLALAAWWAFLYHQRAKLERFLRPLQLSTWRVAARHAAKQLLARNATLRKSALEFQLRRPRFSNDLAPAETIDASVRNGSRFTPVYAFKRVPPEYLVLIERVGERDQQAQFYDALMQRLVSHGVAVERYFFAGDPRECTRNGQDFSLADLAALHPNHFLWIVSDSDRFLNRLTGAPADWVAPLSRWKQRAVLTASTENAFADWLVRTQDFRLVTADPAGLAQLPHRMIHVRETSFVPAWDAFPRLLRSDPVRWLSETEPSPAVRTDLFTQVRRFLGATGYDCLSACAVYPALSWNLTVELTTAVAAGEPVEPILARLVRLPWFRWGTMPDWVRRRLVERLPSAAEQRTNAALAQFLEHSVTLAGRTTDWLEYGRSTPGDESRNILRRWLDRLRRRPAAAAPLQDYVFLSFLWKNNVGPLAPGAPSLLRRLLFKNGYAMFGVRYFAQAAMALLLAAIGWSGTLLWDSAMGPVAVTTPAPPSDYPTGFGRTVLDIARASAGQYTGVPDNRFIDWCEVRGAEVSGVKPLVRVPTTETSLANMRPGSVVTELDPAYIVAVGPTELTCLRQQNGLVEWAQLGRRVSYGWRDLGNSASGPISPDVYLPSVVDWSPVMSAVRTNATIGSVTGIATAEVMEAIIRTRLHQNILLSPLYIYYRARLHDGTQATDAGSTLASAADEMQTVGAVTEQAWPYVERKVAQAPSPAAEASQHYRIAWSRPLKTIDEIRAALAGGPVVLAFGVYESAFKVGSDGTIPMPRAGEPLMGGHAVAAVGYDDSRKVIKFLNSWGTGWGVNGYGYLPYSYTKNLDAMALYGIYSTGANPVPAPPTPAPTGTCTGPEQTIFDNWNAGGVFNGGTPPSFGASGACLVSISTYHFNDGKGAPAGKLGLTNGAGKFIVGPVPAAVTTAQGGVPADWTATFSANQPIVLQGRYTVADSDPATWSQNPASNGSGFARVTVKEFVPFTSNTQNLLEQGLTAHRQGNDTGAIDFYNQALKLNPNDGHVLDLMAYSLFKLRRYPEARSRVEQAVKLGFSYAHLDLARIECAMGDFQAAQQEVAQLMKTDLAATALIDGELQRLCQPVAQAFRSSPPATPDGKGITVTGKVVDEGGNPLANAAISILDPAQRIVARTTTQADGSFQASNVPAPGTGVTYNVDAFLDSNGIIVRGYGQVTGQPGATSAVSPTPMLAVRVRSTIILDVTVSPKAQGSATPVTVRTHLQGPEAYGLTICYTPAASQSEPKVFPTLSPATAMLPAGNYVFWAGSGSTCSPVSDQTPVTVR